MTSPSLKKSLQKYELNHDSDRMFKNDGDLEQNLPDAVMLRTAEHGTMGEDIEQRATTSFSSIMKSLFRRNPGATTISEQDAAVQKVLQTNPAVRKNVEKLQSNAALMESLKQHPVAIKFRAASKNKPVVLTPKNIENVGRAVAKSFFRIPRVSSNVLTAIFFIFGVTIVAPTLTMYLAES
ncbi:hypothetical protein F442_13390 [Phytophthora nicotianae P10297]|uniref:Uncharacterized protein n=3 Tax=Phytophthora nicotianae TaxID=4792 RepID=V9EQR1_PHYNI|nr:hypothetical protein F443_13530 [Phytophthora nicotianae P1569]ETP39141.1 hypothetical protein F442_13390 [Phytophthora nicotianae P10297]KUF81946.1 hypothetical protein AM587_10005447 [Phytophthora nicotianae]KUF89523.1 hypothetical protein AM587_10012881 [Phytophthora nicotianae]